MRHSPLNAILVIACALVGSGCCAAEPPPGYYDPAEGKTGSDLRQALHDIIDDHTVLEYTDTDEAFALTDRDPANPSNVLLVYSRRSEPASCCTGEWNREHVWPNSLGIDRELPPYSDLHNLRPSDYQVNSERGHKFFDETDPTESQWRDPAHPEAPLCTADSNSWEPPESLKGDIARAMFYMAVRYEGDAGEPDLELTDDLAEITTTNSKMGRLTTLLIWHLIDPVSPAEQLRNEGIFTHQGNRNPFVDRPQWVTEIWSTPLQLDLHRNGDQAALTWPADIPRVVIEVSEDLLIWTDLGGIPEQSGDFLSLNIALLNHTRRYFRLAVK